MLQPPPFPTAAVPAQQPFVCAFERKKNLSVLINSSPAVPQNAGVSTSSLRTIQSFTTFDTGTSLATSLNSLVIIDSFDDYCDNDRIIEESTRL